MKKKAGWRKLLVLALTIAMIGTTVNLPSFATVDTEATEPTQQTEESQTLLTQQSEQSNGASQSEQSEEDQQLQQESQQSAEQQTEPAQEQEQKTEQIQQQTEPEQKASEAAVISAWSWVDEDELIDPETNTLALPGASEKNLAEKSDIISLLPLEIKATIGTGDDAKEETITLKEWICEDYPAKGTGSGSYVFTAALPEGYELAEDAPALTVTVELGGAALFAGGTYDFSTNQSPLTINSSNKDQYDDATITGSYTLNLGSDILVIDGVTVNLTIENLTLKNTGATTNGYSPIDLRNNATLNLIVKGTNTLTAEYHAAGIHVPAGCTLNIISASTGTLTVNGGGGYGGGAGIGADGNGHTDGYGSTTQTCGTINIAGGTIIATGGGHYVSGEWDFGGAGIGGSTTGDDGGVANTGTINISGGNVTAIGGGRSAGIGGGEMGYVESVSITGGTVTARAKYGAAIGTGIDATKSSNINCGNNMSISITGGAVTADGNIGYGKVLFDSDSMTGGSVSIGTDASVALTDGHKIDHGDASKYAIIPVTLNVYDGRLTDTTERVTVNATQGGSRIGGAGVELSVSDYHGTGKFNFIVPAGNATGATDFAVTGDDFTASSESSTTLNANGVTVTIGKQLYPVTLTFLDDDKFASDTDYSVNDNALIVKTGDGSDPAAGTIMGTLPNAIEYHSASMGTMVVWLAAGTYDISVTATDLNSGNAMTGNITVSGSATLNLLDNSSAEVLGNLDLSYGPIKFYKDDGGTYRVDYYTAENQYSDGGTNKPTNATVLVSAPFVVTQSNNTTSTTNNITIENWGTDVPLDLTIDGLNIETNTALSKDDNAGHIDINGSAVNLNLSGSSSLKSTYGTGNGVTAALVSVGEGSVLTIDGSGSLTVDTNAYGAAIGGNSDENAGIINIVGGTVTAANNFSGGTGTAIGSGRTASGGTRVSINISGGTVEATKGVIGAGNRPGSGNSSNYAKINITGGTVTAKQGLGASNYGYADITITNAVLTAETDSDSAGRAAIGGGASAENKSTITINSGTVTAIASDDGAAIGSGMYSTGGASITINGGEVTATSTNGLVAAIGGGESGSAEKAPVSVEINGGKVTANGPTTGTAAAIGAGGRSDITISSDADVTISGGTVVATGNIPIGARTDYDSGSSVTIKGGSVNGTVCLHDNGLPTNGGTTAVSLITADLTSTVGNEKQVDADSDSVTATGGTSYGLKDVYTDKDGIVYFWLPENASATFSGADYAETTDESHNRILARTVKTPALGTATDILDVSANIPVTGADAGAKVYYICQTADEEAPAADAIKEAGKFVTANDDGTATIDLTGLTANTRYKVYAVAELDGTISEVSEACNFTTTKTVPTASHITYTATDGGVYNGSGYGHTDVNGVTGLGTITVEYRLKDSGDEYSTDIPIDAGTYESIASIAEGNDYSAVKISLPEFEITKMNLTVKAKDQTITYGGSIAQTTDEIQCEGLAEGDSINTVSLTASTTDATDSGTITPVVTIKNVDRSDKDVTGNYTISYGIGKLTINPKSLEDATISLTEKGIAVGESTYTYDGTQKEPTVTVTDGSTNLDEEHYTVSYSDNINAGTATVTVTGKGNYTGTITKTFKINKADAEITGAGIHIKTFGDAAFGLELTRTGDGTITYAVSSSKDAAGNSADNDKIITVDSSGNVTMVGAGSATITASMAATTNYNAAADREITVTVAKKGGYSVNAINKKYLYSKEHSDTIDLAALLPADCGTATYGTPTTGNAGITFKTKPAVDADGKLTYTVEKGDAGDTQTIEVVATTQNYTDITITVNLELLDKMPVSLKAGEEVTVTNELTYGDAVSKLKFGDAVFVDEDGKEVTGTLVWKTPDATPDAGSANLTWVFKPSPSDSETYAEAEGSITVTVNKATPEISAVPTVEERTYDSTKALTDTDLVGGTVIGVKSETITGTWGWKAARTIPTVDNTSYMAVFTPSDTFAKNYLSVEKAVYVKVNPKEVIITPTADQSKIYGENDPIFNYEHNGLTGNDDISGDLGRKTGEDVGEYAYTLGTLSAGDNYKLTLEGTQKFTIEKAEQAAPTAKLSFALNADGESYTATISKVEGGIYSFDGGNTWSEINTKADCQPNTEYTFHVKYAATKNYNESPAAEVKATTPKPQIKTPTIDPNGGTFMTTQEVKITCGTSNTTIYYTTDSSDPRTSNTKKEYDPASPPVISDNTAIRAIAVREDGSMTNSELTEAVFIKYGEEDEVLDRIETTDLMDMPVPEGLKDKYDSPQQIVEELQRVLTTGGEYTKNNTVAYDVRLQFSLDGGLTWIDATMENFPSAGITVTLPYPTGTGKDTHDFIVTHMFTTDMNGFKAGETEQPPVTKTDKGVKVTLNGLSPVGVAWKEVAKADTPVMLPAEEKPEAPRTPDAEPAAPTGDDANMLPWIIATATAAMIGAGTAFGRRRKTEK